MYFQKYLHVKKICMVAYLYACMVHNICVRKMYACFLRNTCTSKIHDIHIRNIFRNICKSEVYYMYARNIYQHLQKYVTNKSGLQIFSFVKFAYVA